MASLREQLLAAVIAEPSRANCGVYADHLVAAGDPRGELINLDLALDDELADEARAQLVARRTELIAEHALSWWPWMRQTPRVERGVGLVNGFCVSAQMTVAALAGKPECLAGEPIDHLEVTTVTSALPPAALSASWWPRQRRLTLGPRVNDAGVAQVFRELRLDRLEELRLACRSLVLEPGEDRLPRLTRLGVSCPAPDLRSPRGWQHLVRLTDLDLRRWETSGVGVTALLAIGPFPVLETLSLCALVGNEGVARLCARAGDFPALRELRVPGLALDARGASVLLSAGFPALHTVQVGHLVASPDLRARYRVETTG